MWFDLTKYGEVHSIEYLDMDGLITLAESLKQHEETVTSNGDSLF